MTTTNMRIGAKKGLLVGASIGRLSLPAAARVVN
jgi:hypothetical protein